MVGHGFLCAKAPRPPVSRFFYNAFVIPTNVLAAPVIPTEPLGEWRNLFLLWKSRANSTFSKVVKYKGEGKPTLSMRRFPLSFFYTRNSWSFGLLLKMRCIFFTEQPYTDQGSTPGPPNALLFLFATGVLITEFWDSMPVFYGGILTDFRIAECLCSKSV